MVNAEHGVWSTEWRVPRPAATGSWRRAFCRIGCRVWPGREFDDGDRGDGEFQRQIAWLDQLQVDDTGRVDEPAGMA